MPRTPLSRDRILEAAVDFVDDHCVEDLSMRKLGAELGCEAMALYWHVPNKAALLDGVAAMLLAELEAPSADERDWRAAVRRYAASVRRLAHAHPRAFPLVANARAGNAALRDIVAALHAMWLRAGFDPSLAFRASWAVHGYVIGSTMWEILISSAGGDARAPSPTAASSDDAFDYGLELLLRGLESSTAAALPAAEDALRAPAIPR